MSTGGYWWHATGPTASGAVNAIATPATVAAIGVAPTATKRANAKTLFDATLGISTTNVEEHQIGLIWDPVPGITLYDIERNGTIIATNWPDTDYFDLGLTAGTTYTYRVRPKP